MIQGRSLARQLLLVLLFGLSPGEWHAAAMPPGGDGEAKPRTPPRLVVVVAIDQFPEEYLKRHDAGFSPTGVFRRLLAHGAHFTNCRHQQALTFTGPGHSVLLTGAYPNTTGVIDNSWFDRTAGRMVNCVEDTEAPLVGAAGASPNDGRSPRNQLVPTVGDELKLTSAGRACVFGVSFKDRAAILMAGYLADGVFWFDAASGNWITSRYYAEQLPAYVQEINAGQAAEAYAGKSWELRYPPERYVAYRPDDSPFEQDLPPLGRNFPHPLPPQADSTYYKVLASTPFANDLTLLLTRTLVEKEQLGQDEVPDMLFLGLSANDYVGHAFGPYSLEVQDVTYRTDAALGEFAAFLDQKVGENWVLVVSSDHGIAPIPEYAAQRGLPAAREPLGDLAALRKTLEEAVQAELGPAAGGKDYVQYVGEESVYLDTRLAELRGERYRVAQRVLRDRLLEHPAVAACFTREELLTTPAQANASDNADLARRFALTFHPRRSGDVLFALRPYQMQTRQFATTHGSPWEYDRHVVLLLAGPGIRAGGFDTPVSPAQIAPTVSHLLGIRDPAGCAVSPLADALATKPAAVSP
ncbi:MAG: alkaline phosphatase family protein [Planctomycetes bacterium]|nr:alkaline phosphatase family protein [Planctomycetota bacterium]